jgi:hypothetical protein
MGLSVCERLSSRNVPFCSDALSCCAAKTARTRAWCCDHSQRRGNCAHDSWLCVVACAHPSPRVSTTRQREERHVRTMLLSQQARGQTLVSPWRGMRASCCSLVCSRIECSLDPRMEGSCCVGRERRLCGVSMCVITRLLGYFLPQRPDKQLPLVHACWYCHLPCRAACPRLQLTTTTSTP